MCVVALQLPSDHVTINEFQRKRKVKDAYEKKIDSSSVVFLYDTVGAIDSGDGDSESS